MDTEDRIAKDISLYDANSHSVVMTDTTDLQAQAEASLSKVKFQHGPFTTMT
jgi:hypothetical protein